MSRFTHKQYILGYVIKWRLKDNLSDTIECPECNGRGTWPWIGPGIVEECDCSCHKCDGIGSVKNPDIESQPEVPKDLVKAMRKMFLEYAQDNG